MLTIKSFVLSRRLSEFIFCLLVVGGLSGCEHIGGSNLVVGWLGGSPHTVAQLKQSDRQPRQVKIEGEVTHLAPMLNRGAYRLQDDTGAIWVFTEQSLPSLGEKLEVKGELNFQSIEVETVEAGQHFLVEYERKAMVNQ